MALAVASIQIEDDPLCIHSDEPEEFYVFGQSNSTIIEEILDYLHALEINDVTSVVIRDGVVGYFYGTEFFVPFQSSSSTHLCISKGIFYKSNVELVIMRKFTQINLAFLKELHASLKRAAQTYL